MLSIQGVRDYREIIGVALIVHIVLPRCTSKILSVYARSRKELSFLSHVELLIWAPVPSSQSLCCHDA